MAKQLLGKEVNEALVAALQTRTAALKEKGVTPTLGIIRLGENPSDLSYEKGATKRAEEVGVAVKNYILPEDASKEDLLNMLFSCWDSYLLGYNPHVYFDAEIIMPLNADEIAAINAALSACFTKPE